MGKSTLTIVDERRKDGSVLAAYMQVTNHCGRGGRRADLVTPDHGVRLGREKRP